MHSSWDKSTIAVPAIMTPQLNSITWIITGGMKMKNIGNNIKKQQNLGHSAAPRMRARSSTSNHKEGGRDF